MRKTYVLCAVCLLLGGCGLSEKIAAQQAAIDDAKCQSYGAKAGEPAYVQCRAQLDAARTQAQATAAAAPAPPMPTGAIQVYQPPPLAPMPPPMPPFQPSPRF